MKNPINQMQRLSMNDHAYRCLSQGIDWVDVNEIKDYVLNNLPDVIYSFTASHYDFGSLAQAVAGLALKGTPKEEKINRIKAVIKARQEVIANCVFAIQQKMKESNLMPDYRNNWRVGGKDE